MLAAVLTVSGPVAARALAALVVDAAAGLRADPPRHQRHRPGRAPGGLAVGWFVGALVVLVVGTPALEVPLDGCGARDGQTRIRGVRPHGGPARRTGAARAVGRMCGDPDSTAVIELYGPHQRSGGALRQLWRKLRLRGTETAPLQTSMRRAVEHRALMAIAIGDAGRRQHVDDRRRRARPGMDALRAQARSRDVRSTNAPRQRRSRACGNRCAPCTTTRSRTATCAATRSPSTTARCSSAGSAAPNTAPPTPNSSPTSPNCW